MPAGRGQLPISSPQLPQIAASASSRRRLGRPGSPGCPAARSGPEHVRAESHSPGSPAAPSSFLGVAAQRLLLPPATRPARLARLLSDCSGAGARWYRSPPRAACRYSVDCCLVRVAAAPRGPHAVLGPRAVELGRQAGLGCQLQHEAGQVGQFRRSASGSTSSTIRAVPRRASSRAARTAGWSGRRGSARPAAGSGARASRPAGGEPGAGGRQGGRLRGVGQVLLGQQVRPQRVPVAGPGVQPVPHAPPAPRPPSGRPRPGSAPPRAAMLAPLLVGRDGQRGSTTTWSASGRSGLKDRR